MLLPQNFEMLHNDNMPRPRSALCICLLAGFALIPAMSGQADPPKQNATRPATPTRDPNTPGYVTAKELPDGAVPPASVDGNFILGPTHDAAAESADGVPKGTVIEFTMNWSDSKIYPGIAREANTFGTPDPSDPAKLIVTTSHP